MKKFFTLLALCAVAFVACEEKETPTPAPPENEQNPGDDEQKPGDDEQKPEDITYDYDFVAGGLDGIYYAQEFSETYNYNFALSLDGIADMNDASVTQYRFDIYSNTGSGDVPVLPEGVYTIDVNDTYAANTCGVEYSGMINVEEQAMYAYESGTITIAANRIEALLVDSRGKTHRVVYEGSLEISHMNDFGNSTLVEPYSFDFEANFVAIERYGDVYEVGCDLWVVALIQNYDATTQTATGDYVILEVYTSPEASAIAGTYVAGEGDNFLNTFEPGYFDAEGYACGCWLMVFPEVEVYAPLSGGSITISADADGVYSFTFDTTDDNGVAITGTVTGVPEFYDYTEGAAVSALSANALPKHAALNGFSRKVSFAE